MQIKLRNKEKSVFPNFVKDCLKMAIANNYKHYYVMLDVTAKNRLKGGLIPSAGDIILSHTQIEYKSDGAYFFRTWMFWGLLELTPQIYHEELKDIPGEIW